MMERLIIVVDCPDEWRDRRMIDPGRVAREIALVLRDGYDVGQVRARWQSLDADTERGAQR